MPPPLSSIISSSTTLAISKTNQNQSAISESIETDYYIGLLLAISSSIFIGSSFIIKKKALIKLNRSGGLRAGSGGFGYLKEWIWWSGLLTMGIGEIANFTAYAFAPASLVTPLGALSVLVAAVMASKFLNEHLNLLGKMGCVLCLLGSTIIVIHSPKENEIGDLNDLQQKLLDRTFVIYFLTIISMAIIIIFWVGPRYGHSNVTVYIFLCSTIGSLTVMACKALGLAIRDQLSGRSNDFNESWLPYLLIAITFTFICTQMNYLNRALDIFNTSIVTPIYYVMFTTFVIIASAILFKEWQNMKSENIIGDLCGFLIVIIAVILLNAFQGMDISLDDIRGIMRPKRELCSQKYSAAFDEVIVRQNSKDYYNRNSNNYGTTAITRKL